MNKMKRLPSFSPPEPSWGRMFDPLPRRFCPLAARCCCRRSDKKKRGGAGGGSGESGGGATHCNQACKHTSQLFRHHAAFSNVHKQPHRHPVGPAPVPVAAAADARWHSSLTSPLCYSLGSSLSWDMRWAFVESFCPLFSRPIISALRRAYFLTGLRHN